MRLLLMLAFFVVLLSNYLFPGPLPFVLLLGGTICAWIYGKRKEVQKSNQAIAGKFHQPRHDTKNPAA